MDTGFAWVVCCACFVSHVILMGIIRAFGLVFVHILERFDATNSEAATTFAVASSFALFLAPVYASMVDVWSCRSVTIVGTIGAFTGLMISAFSPTLSGIVVGYGVLFGSGCGMVIICGPIIVARHFRRKRTLANGILFSGSGVGNIIMPFLFNYLLGEYGLHGCLLLAAGLCLNVLATGLLYKDPTPSSLMEAVAATETKETKQSTLDDSTDTPALLHSANENLMDSHVTCNPSNENVVHSHVVSSATNENLLSGHVTCKQHDHHPHWEMDYFGSAISLADKEDEPAQLSTTTKAPKNHGLKQFRAKLRNHMDFGLLRNSDLWLVFIANSLQCANFFMTMVLPARATELGIPKNQVALLVSMVGICDSIGRIIGGFIGDISFIRKHLSFTMAFFIGTGSAITLYTAWLKTFKSLLISHICLVPFFGAFIAFTPGAVSDAAGVENMAKAWGMNMFIQGITITISPMAIGGLADATGSYESGYIYIAACTAACTVTCLIRGFIHLNHRMRNPA